MHGENRGKLIVRKEFTGPIFAVQAKVMSIPIFAKNIFSEQKKNKSPKTK